MKLSLDDDIDDAVRFLGGKINPVGHQDYDKAFTSEYWNRMKIRDTLLVIGKVRHYLLAFIIKPLIRTSIKAKCCVAILLVALLAEILLL